MSVLTYYFQYISEFQPMQTRKRLFFVYAYTKYVHEIFTLRLISGGRNELGPAPEHHTAVAQDRRLQQTQRSLLRLIRRNRS